MATHMTPSLSFGSPPPVYDYVWCGANADHAFGVIKSGGKAHVANERTARAVASLLGHTPARVEALLHFASTGAWPPTGPAG